MTERFWEANLLTRLRTWKQQPLADDPQANWDWLVSMLDESEKEIDRLQSALKNIHEMGDEDNEWDGVERFHLAREIAGRAINH